MGGKGSGTSAGAAVRLLAVASPLGSVAGVRGSLYLDYHTDGCRALYLIGCRSKRFQSAPVLFHWLFCFDVEVEHGTWLMSSPCARAGVTLCMWVSCPLLLFLQMGLVVFEKAPMAL